MALVKHVTFHTDDGFTAWTQSDGLGDAALAPDGDNVRGSGGWTATPGNVEDQITSAAAMPGAGDLGFRHAVGDGANNAGGGIRITWTGVSEMYMRWYFRFPVGFSWSTQSMKMVYCNTVAGGPVFYAGFVDGNVGGHAQGDTLSRPPLLSGNFKATMTWADVMGGSTGDGLWHQMQLYCKMNTGSNNDGTWRFYVDAVEVAEWTDVQFSDFGDSEQWSETKLGENHNNPSNGGVVFVDFNDFKIDGTTLIPPVGAAAVGVSVGNFSLR